MSVYVLISASEALQRFSEAVRPSERVFTELAPSPDTTAGVVPMKVAALFVESDGVYYGLPDVEPWDRGRDAREYAGPYPVVAHPPCERWGRYWGGNPMQRPRLILGADRGCFHAALVAARNFGGVIEHPEASHAWRWFGLNAPPRSGGWVRADWHGGWTCCVEQGYYGHRARKATWLYAFGTDLPSLRWGRAPGDFVQFEDVYHSAEERAAAKSRRVKTGACQRLSHKQRAATPAEFRDLLLSIARSAITAQEVA